MAEEPKRGVIKFKPCCSCDLHPSWVCTLSPCLQATLYPMYMSHCVAYRFPAFEHFVLYHQLFRTPFFTSFYLRWWYYVVASDSRSEVPPWHAILQAYDRGFGWRRCVLLFSLHLACSLSWTMQNALHLGSVLPAVSHECKRLRKNSCITGKTWNLLTMEALFITHYRMVLSVKTLARAAHGSTAS